MQKEHETAIKYLQRAVQVDENFAYAYTLLGHEYVMTEEMDKAMTCFRNAIRIDPRHYNAWYRTNLFAFLMFILTFPRESKFIWMNYKSFI